MASLTGLSGTVGASCNMLLSNTADFANATQTIAETFSQAFTVGTGADQVDNFFSDQRTLAGSANETLDLQALTNALGVACVFTKVKALWLEVVSTNADSTITVGASGANAFNAPFGGDDTFAITIRPAGLALFICNDSTGYAVSGTAKDLKIVNNSASSLTYNILIAAVD